MTQAKFAIDEDGNVYQVNGRGRRILGHIASLRCEQSLVAEGVCAWWREQMASEKPLAELGKPRGGGNGASRIVVPETAPVVGGDVGKLIEGLATA
jgi:hypothetical protein